MTHIDPDRLASFAMSDDEPDGAEQAHLAECAVCAADLSESERALELAQEARGVDLIAPPPRCGRGSRASSGSARR